MNNRAPREEIQRAYARLFNTEDGKKVLRSIWREAGVFRNTFNTDSRQDSFNQGKRCLALFIGELALNKKKQSGKLTEQDVYHEFIDDEICPEDERGG